MWAIEVGELNQFHFAGRMCGHLIRQEFELPIQIEGHGGGW
jgi:hypothetical protein